MSEYEVFSGPYSSLFGLNLENTIQKKLCIWTLLTHLNFGRRGTEGKFFPSNFKPSRNTDELKLENTGKHISETHSEILWKMEDGHCVKRTRIRSFSGPYLVNMRENMGQKNSEYGCCKYLYLKCLTLSWRRTGFYMITASVMKGLRSFGYKFEARWIHFQNRKKYMFRWYEYILPFLFPYQVTID